MNNLKELIKQIEKVEGIKLSITTPNYLKADEKIFEDYPYTVPIGGDKTVDDLLNERVYPILHAVENSIGNETISIPKDNVIYLHNNLILGFNNLNQMLEWFDEECKQLDDAEKSELMNMYKGTHVARLIKQTMSKKKKKTRNCD